MIAATTRATVTEERAAAGYLLAASIDGDRSIMKKTAKQLDTEIAAALARRPNKMIGRNTAHLDRKASKPATASKTLREIALIAFPNYKGRKIRLEVADHVDRQVEGGGTFYRDWLVHLSAKYASPVHLPGGFSGSPNLRTKIPFGDAYVSQGVFMGQDSGIRIYLPPIDQATIDVAVDAMLVAGKPTPDVVTMIDNALDGIPMPPGRSRHRGLLRDAYIALVAQLAAGLSSAEAKAERY
jgi:hypothetical protein